MLGPSELDLDHPDDGEDGGADGAAIVAGANPFERGAEGLLVAGKFNLACGDVILYLRHMQLFSSGPRFPPGAFCFWIWNCCYARFTVVSALPRRTRNLLEPLLGATAGRLSR
jgi:hypothetical protein